MAWGAQPSEASSSKQALPPRIPATWSSGKSSYSKDTFASKLKQSQQSPKEEDAPNQSAPNALASSNPISLLDYAKGSKLKRNSSDPGNSPGGFGGGGILSQDVGGIPPSAATKTMVFRSISHRSGKAEDSKTGSLDADAERQVEKSTSANADALVEKIASIAVNFPKDRSKFFRTPPRKGSIKKKAASAEEKSVIDCDHGISSEKSPGAKNLPFTVGSSESEDEESEHTFETDEEDSPAVNISSTLSEGHDLEQDALSMTTRANNRTVSPSLEELPKSAPKSSHLLPLFGPVPRAKPSLEVISAAIPEFDERVTPKQPRAANHLDRLIEKALRDQNAQEEKEEAEKQHLRLRDAVGAEDRCDSFLIQREDLLQRVLQTPPIGPTGRRGAVSLPSQPSNHHDPRKQAGISRFDERDDSNITCSAAQNQISGGDEYINAADGSHSAFHGGPNARRVSWGEKDMRVSDRILWQGSNRDNIIHRVETLTLASKDPTATGRLFTKADHDIFVHNSQGGPLQTLGADNVAEAPKHQRMRILQNMYRVASPSYTEKVDTFFNRLGRSVAETSEVPERFQTHDWDYRQRSTPRDASTEKIIKGGACVLLQYLQERRDGGDIWTARQLQKSAARSFVDPIKDFSGIFQGQSREDNFQGYIGMPILLPLSILRDDEASVEAFETMSPIIDELMNCEFQETYARTLAPETEITPPEIEITPPKVEITPSEVEITPPEVEIAPPEVEIAPPEVEIVPPEVEIAPPEVEIAPPEVEIVPPEVEIAPLEAEITAPEVETTIPEVESTLSKAKSTLPEADTALPKPRTSAQFAKFMQNLDKYHITTNLKSQDKAVTDQASQQPSGAGETETGSLPQTTPGAPTLKAAAPDFVPSNDASNASSLSTPQRLTTVPVHKPSSYMGTAQTRQTPSSNTYGPVRVAPFHPPRGFSHNSNGYNPYTRGVEVTRRPTAPSALHSQPEAGQSSVSVGYQAHYHRHNDGYGSHNTQPSYVARDGNLANHYRQPQRPQMANRLNGQAPSFVSQLQNQRAFEAQQREAELRSYGHGYGSGSMPYANNAYHGQGSGQGYDHYG